jgi:sensor domain CHASE-containing protein
MLKDPIVEEIHRIRDEYAAKFDHDIDRIYADIRRQQEDSGREFLSFKRRPPFATSEPTLKENS